MSELHLIGVFALVVTLIAVSPGENSLLLLRNTPVFNKKTGLLNVLELVVQFFPRTFKLGWGAIIVAPSCF